MSDLGQRLANLSPVKRALFNARLKKKGLDVASWRPITRTEHRASAPLSFAQQRLWFLDLLEPDSPLYNIPVAVRIKGPLNVDALHRALEGIVSRHEAVRTSFVSVDGSPLQIIAESQLVELPQVDLRAWSADKREVETRRLIAKETQQPFDLNRSPLLRTLLLRMEDEDYVLVLTMHHIVSDGWSMGIFFHELEALYSAHCSANPSPLPELPIQYADFAIWQRQWLQGEVLQRQLSYWKKQLGGNLPILELPTDRRRPANQTYRGARQILTISPSLVEALKALSIEEGVTLFMTLLAAFQVLLYRYTGQEDIVIGSPIANRNRAEVEGLIGFFVNTLALRTNMSRDPTFRELMSRVREVALGAFAHQDVPFEKLVEELRPERDPSRTPFFQVMFALQNTWKHTKRLPGLTVTPLETDCTTAKFDLTVSMVEAPDGLTAEFVYNTDLFDASTIERMAVHFLTLLNGLAANPDHSIAALPILTQAERRQILSEWNDTRSEYPRDRCIHELFETQVQRTPDAVAVTFGKRSLTYGELNRRSNQLAHHLRRMGVVSETPVGVHVERSLEMIVSYLGTLKAGGAYVPLDPTYPPERSALMLEDSRAPVLVTQRHLLGRLPRHQAATVILDKGWEPIAQECDEDLHGGATADNLAYAIYTSGSTGKPKGVAVPHMAVNRLVMNTNYIRLGPADVVAQVSNGCFDACTFEVWGALLNGARLVGIAQDVVLSPREFAAQIERHGISALFLTTALFNQLAREIPSAFGNVRNLLFGGETADPRSVREVLRHAPPQRLVHVYGPTEATTFATWYLVKGVAEEATMVPIGRPIANTQIYLLGSKLEPVPVGVAGELYIGGDGLARGYLDRPDLTAESFVANPFEGVDRVSGPAPGRRSGLRSAGSTRLYKTGDLARYRADGNIEFLGRIDHQVKLRGFRIELTEIEAALEQYPAVRQAAVLLREDVPGEKRLAAYIVPQDKSAPTTGELRNFLKAKLPDYMVPPVFVTLDALPLAPNSKIDRQALPPPDQSRLQPGKNFVAPRDRLELTLTKIFEANLGVDPIGIKENFFELGGHSLLAVRLLSQIEKESGKRLPLAEVYQSPTVEQLADILRRNGWTPKLSHLLPVQVGGSRPPFICCHGALEPLARRLGSDQPCYVLEPHGYDGRRAPSKVEQMAANYIKEVRTLQPEGPYYLGGCSFGGMVAHEMALQLLEQGQETALLALIDPTSLSELAVPAGQGLGDATHRDNGSRRKTRRHSYNLLHLGAWKKLSHIWVELRRRIQREIEMAACNICLATTGRVPPSRREFYFYEVSLRAARSYAPRVYPGRVILFRTEENSAEKASRWSLLAGGGMEIHALSGKHHGMLEEPYVQVLAGQLRSCLHKAAGRKSEIRV